MEEKERNRKTRVLVIDDEENIRHYLNLLLEREGFKVVSANNGEEALSIAEKQDFEIILCDIRMPGMDGLQFLKEFRQRKNFGEVVIMSAYGSRDTALAAVRQGAYDYIDKPIQREELLLTLHKLLEREKLRLENQRLRAALLDSYDDHGIIGCSEALRRIMTVARRAAKFPSTIFLTGENGTGKELIARAIHRWSDRSDQAFVAVNCASIPENLLESELFGYKRGAFTGAHKEHAGLFEAANKGTLFLDEVGEIPLSLQAKLLRALDEGKIRRLGETVTRDVDVRIISATNRDIQANVESGQFREDLFYRLHVVALEIPPLRKRKEDIPLLLEYYINRVNARFGTSLKGITPETMKVIMAHDWRGNIRELKNMVEQAVVLQDSNMLTLEMLPEHIQKEEKEEPQPLAWLGEELSIKVAQKKVEKFLIERALNETKGNRSAAARLLEISHRALLYKIKDYKLN